MATASYESGASEKWWDSVAVYGAGMCVIAAFFGPYAPYVLTSHVSVFSHYFKRFERFTKLATSSFILRTACSQTPCKDGIHPRSYERGPLSWFDRRWESQAGTSEPRPAHRNAL